MGRDNGRRAKCFVGAMLTFGALVAVQASGCGNDEGVYCCALRSVCEASSGCQEECDEDGWTEVYNSKNEAECEALLDTGSYTCTTAAGGSYREADAIADCGGGAR